MFKNLKHSRYKIKLSILSINKQITKDIQFYNQAIINQVFN